MKCLELRNMMRSKIVVLQWRGHTWLAFNSTRTATPIWLTHFITKSPKKIVCHFIYRRVTKLRNKKRRVRDKEIIYSLMLKICWWRNQKRFMIIELVILTRQGRSYLILRYISLFEDFIRKSIRVFFCSRSRKKKEEGKMAKVQR